MRRLLPLLAIVLTGCHLIDQKTFAPTPEASPAAGAPVSAAPSPRADPRVPLVVIDYATPNPSYQELLRLAVRAAEARSHTVQYDVVAIMKSPEEAGPAEERAAGVMRAIVAERVPPERVHLALRSEPSVAASQVRVYVR